MSDLIDKAEELFNELATCAEEGFPSSRQLASAFTDLFQGEDTECYEFCEDLIDYIKDTRDIK